jgi:hypothetical protein
MKRNGSAISERQRDDPHRAIRGNDVQNDLRVQRTPQSGSETKSQTRMTGSSEESDSTSQQWKN